MKKLIVCAMIISLPFSTISRVGADELDLDDIGDISAPSSQPEQQTNVSPPPQPSQIPVSNKPASASKGIFFAALAPIAAQVVGQGLSYFLSKLTDSLFSNNKPQAVREYGTNQQVIAYSPNQNLTNSHLQTISTERKAFGNGNQIAPGVVARILKLDSNDIPVEQITMNSYVESGNAFILELTTNLSGLLTVTNITPSGERKKLTDDFYVISGETIKLPKGNNVFYFDTKTGKDSIEVLFTPCKSDNIGQSKTLTRAESNTGFKDILTRQSRNTNSEYANIELGVTKPEIHNLLQTCGTKDISIRPAKTTLDEDGAGFFLDPNVINTQANPQEISGTIRAMIEFNHI